MWKDLSNENDCCGLIQGSAVHVDCRSQWQNEFDDIVIASSFRCAVHGDLQAMQESQEDRRSLPLCRFFKRPCKRADIRGIGFSLIIPSRAVI